ncbi:MAG: AraC family transcriptional regulator [Kofleriaceae bacterium]
MELSAASLRCKNAVPSKRCVSSDWSSLLVDVHTGIHWNKTYTAVTTLDPRIGVSLRGQYLSHYYSRGVWRPDVFAPNTTTVLRSDETRRFRFAPLDGNDCEFALIYIPLAQLEQAIEHLRRPGQRTNVPWFNQFLARDPAIAHVARAAIHAMNLGVDELYAGTVSAWLSAHILVGKRAPDSRTPGELTDRRLARVIELISVHFADRLTLEQLAAEAGISKYHFTRLFRQKVGMTPYRFVQETRLAVAREMLVSTDLPIAEVGARCGYPAASHFATAFSSRYGMSPAAVRTA